MTNFKTLTPMQRRIETAVIWATLPIVAVQYVIDCLKFAKNRATR